MCAFSERRPYMDSSFIPPISIEKFAAYLDRNLSSSEMEQISTIIELDNDLQQIRDMSNTIDEDMAVDNLLGYELPSEIKSLDFELPNIADALSPELYIGESCSYNEHHYDAAACASEEENSLSNVLLESTEDNSDDLNVERNSEIDTSYVPESEPEISDIDEVGNIGHEFP